MNKYEIVHRGNITYLIVLDYGPIFTETFWRSHTLLLLPNFSVTGITCNAHHVLFFDFLTTIQDGLYSYFMLQCHLFIHDNFLEIFVGQTLP